MRAQRPVVHQHYLGMTALPQTRLLRLRFTHPAASRGGSKPAHAARLAKAAHQTTIAHRGTDGRQDESLSRGLRALAARPAGVLGRGRAAIDWYERPKKVFDPAAGVYGRWFAGGVCNTCWNAVDRHVVAAARSAGDHLRLAGHQHQADDHLRRAADRTELLAGILKDSASARATASSSTCRWSRRRSSRCSPARASAPFTRWCSAASRPTSSPPASMTPSRRSSCPRAAASSRRASWPTSRCSTRRSTSPRTSRRRA